jgi:16S rRNA (uracil1498-N3)-methyltransferase
MSTPRFYCPSIAQAHHSVSLPANAAVHAVRVLRLQPGDTVVLFNGDGLDYTCKLAAVRKNEVTAEVLSTHVVARESPLNIKLAQAISTGDRMDFTVQKAVELGISAIQPIASQRSVVKLTGDRADKRREHWQNVAISACEQSGRAVVPKVAAPLSLPNWLAGLEPHAVRLTLSPGAERSLHDLPPPGREAAICLLIGPEGGLSAEEIDLATGHNFIPVRLGPRILRTETAALTALSAIQTLWGDFR